MSSCILIHVHTWNAFKIYFGAIWGYWSCLFQHMMLTKAKPCTFLEEALHICLKILKTSFWYNSYTLKRLLAFSEMILKISVRYVYVLSSTTDPLGPFWKCDFKFHVLWSTESFSFNNEKCPVTSDKIYMDAPFHSLGLNNGFLKILNVFYMSSQSNALKSCYRNLVLWVKLAK